jgi:hypothetical protein
MITASIVVFNAPVAQVKRAAKCILSNGVEHLYIVFNGNDPTYLNDLGLHNAELIVTENRGFGAGHNIAIRKAITAGATFHLVANADLWWDGDVITPMTDFLKSHPNVGLISPKVLYPNGKLQYTCRMLPTPIQLFGRRFLPMAFKKSNDRYLLKNIDHSKTINAPYLLGCFMLFRCSALQQDGLFDERFFMYPEDIDITRRLHQHWQTLYWPHATIVHEHARESYHNYRLLRIHIVNMCRYFNKWGWLCDKERTRFNNELRNLHSSPRLKRAH